MKAVKQFTGSIKAYRNFRKLAKVLARETVTGQSESNADEAPMVLITLKATHEPLSVQISEAFRAASADDQAKALMAALHNAQQNVEARIMALMGDDAKAMLD